MNREIMKIVNRVVSEEFSGRISNIKNQLFENEGETCECGGMMYEGECMECGNMYEGDIQELGGMEDGHPRFGNKRLPKKMSIEDIERLLKGNEEEEMYSDDEESEWEEIEEGEDSYDAELDEKLYGNQHKIDKNKNGRIDRRDFEMLRGKKTETKEGAKPDFLDLDDDGDKEESMKSAAKSSKKVTKESKVYFTESEMIDIIENIVNEEKKKGKAPSAQNILKSSLNLSKKENDDYIKSVTKKMKDYLKDASKGDFEMDPTEFPEGNYDLENRKEKIKKYTPSDAVDEYIDAFSYPGMTNLVYDEIKPNDKNIEKYLKGDKTTGNAEVDEDGKALGNVVPSEVGEKFLKNYKENLYGQEQMTASYKRQSQPVDMAGDDTESGSLKSKKGKKTAQGVLDALDESVEDQKVILEMQKMKNIIGYNRKTQ
jgi:hypothetical protein